MRSALYSRSILLDTRNALEVTSKFPRIRVIRERRKTSRDYLNKISTLETDEIIMMLYKVENGIIIFRYRDCCIKYFYHVFDWIK